MYVHPERRSRSTRNKRVVTRSVKRKRARRGGDGALKLLERPGLYFIAMSKIRRNHSIQMKVGMSRNVAERIDSYLTYHPDGFEIYGVLYTNPTKVRLVEQYAHHLLSTGLDNTNYHTYSRNSRLHGHTLEWFSAPLHVFRMVYYMCKYFARLRIINGKLKTRISPEFNCEDEDRFLKPALFKGNLGSGQNFRHTPAGPKVSDLIYEDSVMKKLDDVKKNLENMQKIEKQNIEYRWAGDSAACTKILDDVYADHVKKDEKDDEN